MARRPDIRTNQADVACDVCGRTLLRGEHAEAFLAGGAAPRRSASCAPRAPQHEGWIRESGGDDLGAAPPRAARAAGARCSAGCARAASGARDVERRRSRPSRRRPRRRRPPTAPRRGASATASRRPSRAPTSRAARATCAPCPTNAELKMERALEVFNALRAPAHRRRRRALARRARRSCVRPLADRPSVVAITVMWELSLVPLRGRPLRRGRRRPRASAQGDELAELDAERAASPTPPPTSAAACTSS